MQSIGISVQQHKNKNKYKTMIGAVVGSTTANAGAATSAVIQRSTIQLYRDCLRLVRHVAPGETSPKGIALRITVKSEFRKHQHLVNVDDIDTAKASAIRALSNYMLTNSARKDPKVASAMDNFHHRSVQDAKRSININNNNTTTTTSSTTTFSSTNSGIIDTQKVTSTTDTTIIRTDLINNNTKIK